MVWRPFPSIGHSQFLLNFADARTDLFRELALLGARDVVLSSNIPIRRDGLPSVPEREPIDPGIALYFTRAGKSFVLACDAYERVHWNLRAVGATIHALRSIERHGATSMLERAFSGFLALPAPRAWREVLGLATTANADQVRAAYRELAKLHHPDRGGTEGRMAEINRAYQEGLAELGAKDA
jgi:hypothetical protein